jgi:hypothetical protein
MLCVMPSFQLLNLNFHLACTHMVLSSKLLSNVGCVNIVGFFCDLFCALIGVIVVDPLGEIFLHCSNSM